MRLDASTAEVAQFLRAKGYKLTIPVDAELYEDRARVAVQGGRHVVVTRGDNGLLKAVPECKPSLKMDWLGMEREIREVLSDPDFEPEDALACIDEILARYTRRGNERQLPDDERQRLANWYPQHFERGESD